MGPVIAGSVYLTAAILAARYLILPKPLNDWQKKAVLFWILNAILMFFAKSENFAIIFSTLYLFFTMPKNTKSKLLFYISILPSIPLFYSIKIPFPGLNYLIEMDFVKISAILLLININNINLSNKTLPRWPIYVFWLLSTVLSLRELPITSAFRFGFDSILIYILPFLAFSGQNLKLDDVEKKFIAFISLATIMGCIAIISELVNWNIYSFLHEGAFRWKYSEHRFGLLRVGVTVGPTVLAFIMACGMLGLLLVGGNVEKSARMFKITLFAIFFVAIAITFSRGGWLATIVMLCSYRIFKSKMPNKNIVTILITSIFILTYISYGTNLYELDEFGTFEYRANLYKTSFDQFLSSPWFGEIGYRNSEKFSDLIQGEGIVDIVSVYLGILLEYGIIGFILFFSPFLFALFNLLRIRREAIALDRDKNMNLFAAVIALILGYLTMIATISAVSLVIPLGFVVLGIGYTTVREGIARNPS